MAKRKRQKTSNDMQNITQKTKCLAPIKIGGEFRCSRRVFCIFLFSIQQYSFYQWFSTG